jgi:pimeloyl-ACP methyl ester carboxylesterase
LRRLLPLTACIVALAGGSATAGRTAPSALVDPRPCGDETPGFTCSTLRVPLDRAGDTPGTLDLAVAVADRTGRQTRGVLLILTGGPGQPGVPFVARVLRNWAAPLADAYRIVMLDQRGTGGGALRCPALQRIMGSSDLKVPTASAVRSCAAAIGQKRRFFTTADTVADLDALREALGVDRWMIDGASYGSYVAERYALAHPNRVTRLVLDSIVPHDGRGLALYTASMSRTATVLRAVCRAQRCVGDPAADLAAVVRRDHNGPAVQDAIVAMSVIDPTFRGVPEALHDARRGDRERLRALLRYVQNAEAAPAEMFSQGLHAATLCEDLPFPWGRSDAPPAARKGALQRAVARLRRGDIWPYNAATARGNGLVQTCLLWPRTLGQPLTLGGNLPDVPTLLLAGDRDLSTPLAWARWEAAHAPGGRLVVVKGAGHSVLGRAVNGAGRAAMRAFLLG